MYYTTIKHDRGTSIDKDSNTNYSTTSQKVYINETLFVGNRSSSSKPKDPYTVL